jgi:hypothetical protein
MDDAKSSYSLWYIVIEVILIAVEYFSNLWHAKMNRFNDSTYITILKPIHNLYQCQSESISLIKRYHDNDGCTKGIQDMDILYISRCSR